MMRIMQTITHIMIVMMIIILSTTTNNDNDDDDDDDSTCTHTHGPLAGPLERRRRDRLGRHPVGDAVRIIILLYDALSLRFVL